ncbi:hypothetical protein, partial [Escherichia coli]|uniref:hypothetical protein n=1 Tax=Escherichia coli TaxID=562 RepID=UPI00178C44BF
PSSIENNKGDDHNVVKEGGNIDNAHGIEKTNVWKSPWTSLFKDNREPNKGMKLKFIEPVGEFVDLSNRKMPSIVDIWGFCLV